MQVPSHLQVNHKESVSLDLVSCHCVGLFHREVVPDGTMVAPPVLQAACRPVVEQIELAANTLATPQPLPGWCCSDKVW